MERKTRGYTEDQVLQDLKKKNDIRVVGKQIQQLSSDSAKGDVGNSSKGKIDFLVKYCGYTHFFVKDFKR
jgi:hypothetical protein